jgi:hypothetical protein
VFLIPQHGCQPMSWPKPDRFIVAIKPPLKQLGSQPLMQHCCWEYPSLIFTACIRQADLDRFRFAWAGQFDGHGRNW